MPEYDYSTITDHKLYKVAGAFGWLKNVLYKTRVEGLENVPPPGKGMILAANHLNYRDPAILVMTVGNRHPFHFMGKQELFDNPLIFFFLSRFNGFPVKRGQHDDVALNYAKDIVRSGRTLGMFIEGSRAQDTELRPPKTGVARIAQDTHADILPVSIYSETKGKFFTPLTVRFGKVIPFEELCYDGSGTREELQAVANQIMDAIRIMWEQGHNVEKKKK